MTVVDEEVPNDLLYLLLLVVNNVPVAKRSAHIAEA